MASAIIKCINKNYHNPKVLLAACLAVLICGAFGSRAAADVTLVWDTDSDPNIVGYHLYSGTTSGVYTQEMEVGNSTATSLSNLAGGTTYFFVVTAYNAAAVESVPSNEVSYTAPLSTASPTPTPTPTPTATPTPS